MKVSLLVNIGSNDTELPPLKEGEQEVDNHIGGILVKRGQAIDLTPPPKIEAVPPAPTIKAIDDRTEEKATADLKTYRDKASRETKPSK